MIKVRAKIRLYKIRKTPFKSGYRPLFNFIDEMKTSGQITLLDRKKIFPGESGYTEILFLNKEYLGKDFSEGVKFTFDEGSETLGEGEIISIIEE